jgi:hypothetical protein
MDDLIQATEAAVRRNIPDLAHKVLSPEYSYHSLPLCIIDAVFSIGVRYTNVKKVVEAWCVAHRPSWQKYGVEGMQRKTVSDLINETEGFHGLTAAAKFFGGNKQRTSTRNGILKADAVVLFAKAVRRAGVEDFADIRRSDMMDAAREAVASVPGHRSGISFDYLMMLAGDESYVKADRMICGFVAEAAGVATVTAEEARTAVVGACKALLAEYPNLTPRRLDHVIWNHQRKRKQSALSRRPACIQAE